MMQHTIRLIVDWAFAKYANGDMTKEELREAIAELIQTAREWRVIVPSLEEMA